MTHLLTDAAAHAKGAVNGDLAALHGSCGAAQLHAVLTAYAFLLIGDQRLFMLYVLQQGAGPAADDHRGLLCSQFFLQDPVAGSQIIGIHHSHTVEAHGAAQRLQVDLSGRIPLNVVSGGGILLVTGHTGNGVVQNANLGVGLVIGNIHEAGDTGVNEGGVTDNGNGLLGLIRKRLRRNPCCRRSR